MVAVLEEGLKKMAKKFDKEFGALMAEIMEIPEPIAAMKIMQAAFKCHRCGECCTNINGVGLMDADIKRLCKHLKCGTRWFETNMIEPKPRHQSKPFLKGSVTNRRCPYYNNGCTVYEARPLVCRVYPLMNDDERGYTPHLYDNCPGTIELAQEIQVQQLLNGGGRPTVEDNLIFGAIRVQAHLKVIDLCGFKDLAKRYARLCKAFKPWDEVEATVRPQAIRYLAFTIPPEHIDQYLCAQI